MIDRYRVLASQVAWLLVIVVFQSSKHARCDDDLFEASIRPILIAHCFECHGKDESANNLRVGTREDLLKGGDAGPAITPGDAESSLLIMAIRRTHDDLQMPPNATFDEHVIADFERWINTGAAWPKHESLARSKSSHWAFLPLANIAMPEAIAHSTSHPIDRFIKAKWREHNIAPVSVADARTLVRRLFYDLIGLPPTPQQMGSAVRSLEPWNEKAWSELIEDLLASPQYGERWGRHWLDVARYADTAGDNADYPIPEAHRYRDYVIDAFNADKPYDQFVREQIAGDILAAEGPSDRYAEQVTATGFLALSRRYATGPYELWHLTLEDTIDTVGQAFMGVTMRCARCHDHKFDPISQRDYYALYGIFDSTQFPWAGAEEFSSQKLPRQHFVSLLPPHEAEPLRRAHHHAAQSADEEDEELKKRYHADFLRGYPAEIPSAYGVTEGSPHSVPLQVSGDPGKPSHVVPRGPPRFLPSVTSPTIPENESGRRQLAEWLTRRDHPLTARVMVNRIWQHHFGRGIVATPSNFGTRGAKPTHPELLDWLSIQFMDSGWSIKQMHRLILNSQSYRLCSEFSSENAAIDPNNELLWRHERRRLDAESIRDSLLAISGLLRLEHPGAHPFPPITDWNYTQHNQFQEFYPTPHRSVYLMTTRLQRHPFLALFDGPDTNTTTDRRQTSIVPSQALYLMNSKDVRETAEAFARRIAELDARDRIRHAFMLAYQREPTASELSRTKQFLTEYSSAAKRDSAGEENSNTDKLSAWTALSRSLLTSHEVFYVD